MTAAAVSGSGNGCGGGNGDGTGDGGFDGGGICSGKGGCGDVALLRLVAVVVASS